MMPIIHLFKLNFFLLLYIIMNSYHLALPVVGVHTVYEISNHRQLVLWQKGPNSVVLPVRFLFYNKKYCHVKRCWFCKNDSICVKIDVV